jgi:hypothetical protein
MEAEAIPFPLMLTGGVLELLVRIVSGTAPAERIFVKRNEANLYIFMTRRNLELVYMI